MAKRKVKDGTAENDSVVVFEDYRVFYDCCAGIDRTKISTPSAERAPTSAVAHIATPNTADTTGHNQPRVATVSGT